MSTKIFCDIADLNLIRKFNKKKIVKGFTTNPSLMRKAGAKNYQKYSKQILKICKKNQDIKIFFWIFMIFVFMDYKIHKGVIFKVR